MSYWKSIRDALKTDLETIDVSAVLEDSWKFKSRYPIKQAPGYPGFYIAPARNTANDTVDSATQELPFTFWIYLVHSYDDPNTSEDQLIDLADLVIDHLMERIESATSLLPGIDFDGSVSGEWGFDAEYGERFYRIEVTLRTLMSS